MGFLDFLKKKSEPEPPQTPQIEGPKMPEKPPDDLFKPGAESLTGQPVTAPEPETVPEGMPAPEQPASPDAPPTPDAPVEQDSDKPPLPPPEHIVEHDSNKAPIEPQIPQPQSPPGQPGQPPDQEENGDIVELAEGFHEVPVPPEIMQDPDIQSPPPEQPTAPETLPPPPQESQPMPDAGWDEEPGKPDQMAGSPEPMQDNPDIPDFSDDDLSAINKKLDILEHEVEQQPPPHLGLVEKIRQHHKPLTRAAAPPKEPSDEYVELEVPPDSQPVAQPEPEPVSEEPKEEPKKEYSEWVNVPVPAAEATPPGTWENESSPKPVSEEPKEEPKKPELHVAEKKKPLPEVLTKPAEIQVIGQDDIPIHPLQGHPSFGGMKPGNFLSSDKYFEIFNDIKETRKLLRESDYRLLDALSHHEKCDDKLAKFATCANDVQEAFMELDAALFEH